MFVAYDTEFPPPRQHPWTVFEANPEERHWDFKAHPEQIPRVLEDFKPWSQYAAIGRFYDLLAWLNGSDSIFESNDCGLRPPRRDGETPDFVRRVFDADPVVVHGRLAIIFRDLAWNVSAPTVDGLKKTIHDALRDNVSNMPAVVKVGDWAHLFTPIDKEGRAVTLIFWAWGDDDDAAMGCLKLVFDAFHGCLKWISDGVKGRSTSR